MIHIRCTKGLPCTKGTKLINLSIAGDEAEPDIDMSHTIESYDCCNHTACKFVNSSK